MSWFQTHRAPRVWRKAKGRLRTRFKAALTFLYCQTSKPESPTDKDIYENSSKEDLPQKFQVWWSYTQHMWDEKSAKTESLSQMLGQKLSRFLSLTMCKSSCRLSGTYFCIIFINDHWPKLIWLWPIDSERWRCDRWIWRVGRKQ